MNNKSEITNSIKNYAYELGFDLVGISPPDPYPDNQYYREWVEKGFAGEMNYLKQNISKREDPNNVLSNIKSLITCAINYNTNRPYSIEVDKTKKGWVARYAWGEDYHNVLEPMLRKLKNYIETLLEEKINTKAYVDTGPILEKVFAKNSGIGWIGKNTCLINQKIGSWLFLGEILTDVELEFDGKAADRCGTCTKCIDACPTGAITEPYVLDSRNCISYLTIELKGKIPESMREGIENNIFGCDICQDVCPWNRNAPISELLDFQPRDKIYNPDLKNLLNLDGEDFRTLFKNSPIKRSKRKGFLRNVLVAAANSKESCFSFEISKLLNDEEPLVRAHAVWALWKIEGSDCLNKLYDLYKTETNEMVIEELNKIFESKEINDYER
ncbi:MAG: tRNA epoxyqueuosine(34) reductase QueG [Thermodesulfobacteriota bacterium]